MLISSKLTLQLTFSLVSPIFKLSNTIRQNLQNILLMKDYKLYKTDLDIDFFLSFSCSYIW